MGKKDRVTRYDILRFNKVIIKNYRNGASKRNDARLGKRSYAYF